MSDQIIGQESPLRATLTVEIAAELRSILDEAAETLGMPLNRFVSRLLAKAMKRPDLAKVPQHRRGRPRKIAS